MAEICVLSPLVKGEKSRLYGELLEFTNNNRKLTNFLYALSKQESVRSQFTKKDFNSQGELRLEDFVRKYNLKQFIPDVNALKYERKQIGSIDDNGEYIKYDTAEELYDKVVDYNDTHSRYKATISYDNGKFIIKLDTVNASNFRNGEVLKTRLAQFNGINAYLRSQGFSTDYSKDTKVFANFNNVKFFQTSLADMRSSLENLSVSRANLLLDLMKDRSKAAQRILASDALNVEDFSPAEAISIVSSEKSTRIDEYWRRFINDFLDEAQRTLRSDIDMSKLEEAKKQAAEEIEHTDAEWLGTSSEVLNSTLNELYEKYHLDQDLIADAQGSLDSLSGIAKKLFNLDLTRYDIAKHQMLDTTRLSATTSAAQRDISNGRYAESIISCLGDLLREFVNLDKRFETAKDTILKLNREDETDLEKLNKLSNYIYDTIKVVGAYQPVIDALMNADRKVLDQPDLPEDFINQIRVTAQSLNTLMRRALDSARDAQFEAVVAYFGITSWGAEDVRTFSDNTQKDLREIVKTLAVDPTFFDRFIYSLNEADDAGLALIHNSIKARHRARNEKLREVEYIVRTITNDLEKSGHDSKNLFARDADGNLTGRFKSYIDYDAYEKDKKTYMASLHKEGIRGRNFDKKMNQWQKEHRDLSHKLFNGRNKVFNDAFAEYCYTIYGELPYVLDAEGKKQYTTDISFNVPDPAKYMSTEYDKLSEPEKIYFSKMLALKTALSLYTPDTTDIFDAIQVSGDILNALGETGGDPAKLVALIKNKFKDSFSIREDDTDFGETYGDVLEANGMKQAVMDLNGHEFMQMPLFFTHKLKDMSRLSTDLSQSMLAYAQTNMQYYEMNKVIDSLQLIDDYFRNVREPQAKPGGKGLVNMVKSANDTFVRSITGEGAHGGMLTDLYEKELYGRKKKEGGSITMFGVEISASKAADWLTGYTSRTGLVVNYLGAQANVLVGKMQMFIEGAAKEFFGYKDLGSADAKYMRYLPEYLNEYASNNKRSFLALLGDKFDIMEDYFQELRDKGFKTSAIGKILNNTNLFMLYGMGEHYLHFTGALAVLHANKVRDSKTGNDVTLLEAMEESYRENEAAHPEDSNLRFYFNFDRYQWLDKGSDGKDIPRKMTESDLLKVEKQITYVNKSMHGAFNDLEKGLASRYAAGRLIMNFRQWMPAHYQRRFRGLHYDADLGDMRQGYYVSLWKFLVGCVKDLGDKRVQIGTRWEELSDMDKANMKRVLAEITTMMCLSISNLCLGEYKDKKGNWAYRNLMYQVKRVLMETKASTPIPDLLPLVVGEPVNPMSFVDNIMQVLNSPAAALNTIDNITTMLDLTKLFFTVESGPHEGENLYLHGLRKVAPYYGSLTRQASIKDEDYVFQLFTK